MSFLTYNAKAVPTATAHTTTIIIHGSRGNGSVPVAPEFSVGFAVGVRSGIEGSTFAETLK